MFKMTDYINGFCEYLRTAKNSSKNTLESYSRDIRAYLAFLDISSQKPENADKKQIEKFLQQLERQGKTNSTLVRSLASVRSFYQYLVYLGTVDSNPTKGIVLKKAEKKLPEILTQKEIDALISQPDITTLRGCRDKAMLELMYATGLRVTELIDLNIEDINLQVSIIHCRSEKSDRIIPVYRAAVKAVEDYLSRVRPVIATDKAEKSLFLNLNGDRLTRQGMWKIIKGYAEEAQIKKTITPHTIRHSFAAHLLENGAGIKDIKDMLGHSGISSTQVYTQIVKEMHESSYKRFHPKAGL